MLTMKSKTTMAHMIAFVWGLAEATFFFIVPDVFISYRAIRSIKAALWACVYALCGALIGGLLMFGWAVHSPRALDFVRHVPAINAGMVQEAHQDFAEHGAVAVLIAPIKGSPYKLYSVLSPTYGVPIAVFLGISIIARISRFVLVALAAAALSKFFSHWFSDRTLVYMHVVFWVIFYSLYFYSHR